MEEVEKRRPGRPATGVTPKRNLRMGQTWDTAAELAAELDESMTAFTERALRREIQRVLRERSQG